MKTFEEAYDSLIDKNFDPVRSRMDKYEEVGIEILSSSKTTGLGDYFIQRVSDGRMSQMQAIRYAFGQGVLIGIEMEKP